jgi:hypothetical protein
MAAIQKTLDIRAIRSKGALEGPWEEVLAFLLVIGVVLGGKPRNVLISSTDV